jgi:hypothetical protein
MPDEKRSDEVEKVLADQKAIDDRKQVLIEELLRQKADALKAFDEKLLKLGHKPDGAKTRRNHHKVAPEAAAKPKAKA